MRFFTCEECGTMFEYIGEAEASAMCNGQKITEVIPGTTDGAHEKHIPVVKVDGDRVIVDVGTVEHPMMEEHFIQWVVIETTNGSQRKMLHYQDKPKAEFKLTDGEKFVAAYEYCNLHGLWKAQE